MQLLSQLQLWLPQAVVPGNQFYVLILKSESQVKVHVTARQCIFMHLVFCVTLWGLEWNYNQIKKFIIEMIRAKSIRTYGQIFYH